MDTRPAVWTIAALVLVSLVVSRPLSAQAQPNCAGGCLGGVSVTPDGGTDSHPMNTGPWNVVFDVLNTGVSTKTFTFTCSTTGGMSCVSVTPSSVSIKPDRDKLVTVSYNVGGSSGNVWLTATATGSSDDGYFVITATAVEGPPMVALRNHNGDNRDRSLCLTSGAGEGAAWECGDLVVTHGLPAYMTKGRARSLTLLYNSAQALPRPAVAVSVNEASVAPPTTVFVKLSVNGTARDSATFTGWGSSPSTRQIVLAHDATTDSSGIYPFTLLVRNQYADSTYETTLSDTLLVVNRATSPYGTGWTLVGVEELRASGQPGNEILWIGGDGSAKVYRSAGTNTWVAAAGGFRDTLTWNPAASLYTRSLRHGVKVRFDLNGHHVRTINRVGDSTVFTWSGSPLRLTGIQVPPGIGGTTYTLSYDGAHKLDKITDPAGRILDVAVVSNRLTQIIDPDTSAVHTDFSYDGSGRLTGRTNRRGFTNSFVYAKGLHVDTVKVRLDTASATYAVTAFRPWDEEGFAVGLSGQTAVDSTLAYTKIDGPRPAAVGDTAEFWVDRWGAPTRIRNPLGYLTTLARGDAANPALVTRVQDPLGAVAQATYNSRGNLLTVTDSTHQGSGASPAPAVTSYQYTDANDIDAPSKISTPVDTTVVAYNSSVHLPSQVTAQGGHITTFSYTTTGTLRGVLNSVTEQAVRVVDTVAWTKTAPGSSPSLTTSFAYDALGNDTLVTTPGGMKTRYRRDAVERVDTVYDPLSHWVAYTLNPANRITEVRQQEVWPTAVVLVTKYNYTPTGAIKSVVDPRNATRSYRYDAADRPVQMVDDVGGVETRYFAPSGLLDSTRTRIGHVIRNTFDQAGQLTQTIYPQNTYVVHSTVPGDTINRTYDAAGRLLTAQNHYGTVTYTYNLEGTVKTERQLVTGAVDVTLRSWYDAGNRRTIFFNGTDTISYTYGPDAQLAKLKVHWMAGGLAADSFNFFWDGLGRRDSLKYSNGTAVSYGYDRDGHFRMLCSKHPGGDTGVLDFLEQRVRVEAENGEAMPVTRYHYAGPGESSTCAAGSSQVEESILSATYDARHQLIASTGVPTAQTVHYDNSGNIRMKQLGALPDSFTFVNNSNRLSTQLSNGTPATAFTYDPNGNRIVDSVLGSQYHLIKRYYYNALNQLVGDSESTWNGTYLQWVGVVGNCQYDALGRRVAACGAANTPYRVFDGDNTIIAKSAAGNMQWRFVQGPGTDDPLVAAWTLAGSTIKYYYLTDGQGGHLAFTDPNGYDYSTSLDYTQNGGNQAGGIERTQRFDNSRAESDQAPGLSFYRNRYYDQATGRWLQEDAIGIAGGVNLYAYAGNNPVTFTDPFGLKVDTVEYASPAVRKAAEGCAKATKTCAQQLTALQNDPSKWRVQYGSLPDHLTGNTNTQGYPNRVTGGTITIDPSHFAAASTDLGVTVNFNTTFGHELGHANGNIQIANTTGNLGPTNHCDEKCANIVENKVRGELGLPLLTPKP